MGTGKPPKRADARGVAGERLTEPRPAAAPGAHGDRPALSPAIVLAALVMLAGAAAAAYLLVGAGGDGEPEVRARPHRLPVPWVDPDGVRPIVGALDVNPGDGSLWLATNTGLFRLPRDAKRPEPV